MSREHAQRNCAMRHRSEASPAIGKESCHPSSTVLDRFSSYVNRAVAARQKKQFAFRSSRSLTALVWTSRSPCARILRQHSFAPGVEGRVADGLLQRCPPPAAAHHAQQRGLHLRLVGGPLPRPAGGRQGRLPRERRLLGGFHERHRLLVRRHAGVPWRRRPGGPVQVRRPGVVPESGGWRVSADLRPEAVVKRRVSGSKTSPLYASTPSSCTSGHGHSDGALRGSSQG